MKRLVTALSLCVGGLFLRPAEAATITVTTTNNVSPPAGQTSFAQALATAKNGDTIAFNIPGGGPHYIATPPAPNPVDRGYPLIRAHNLTIDGYTQPGSSPNSNPILFANNAKIKIFLDSRQGEATLMNFDGYGPTEAGILPVVGATNVMVRGLGFLGQLITQPSILNPAVYCVAFGQGARGHVNGCWFGVDADGKTVYGANAGVTGFRFVNDVTGVPFFPDNTAIGVKPGSSGADEQFNVIVGMKIPIIIEGSGLRVSGNFIGVLPSGTNEYNNAVAGLPSEGAVQIGRTSGDVVIGTDGNGDNDSSERNIISGVVPNTVDPNGYNHLIEFYGGGTHTNIVIAGNYIGVGVDGLTRFTNGVPLVSGLTADARIGSDFDGVSDALEGNIIFNHYPTNLATGASLLQDFVQSAGVNATISVRGNKLVNNFTPPVNPMRDGGTFLASYYSKAIVNLDGGVLPILATNTTVTRLVGTIPLTDTNFYPLTTIDLYIADPEGLAKGLAEGLPTLPDGSTPGFVQGLTYLGSLFEGSANDLDATPGKFSFNVGSLNIPVGALLTITANYSQGRIGAHNAPTITTLFSTPVRALAGDPNTDPPGKLSIVLNGNSITITFKGVLQSATAITGPWADVTDARSPTYSTQASQTTRFFRARSL